MKKLLLSLVACTLAAPAFAGKVSEYLYTYGSTPVDAPVTAINPPPGSVVIDTTTGVHYRKISAVDSNATYAVEPVQTVFASVPLTGETITASNANDDQIYVLTPAGTIAAQTFVFPSNANSRIGQEITIQSSQIVSTLTLTKGGQTITDPAGTALAVNVPQRWIKTAASVWTRISNVATDSGVVLTGSVITDGLTASGSAGNDFSASTGAFKTSTGTNTFGGTGVIAANKSWSVSAGTTAFDLSGGTGVTKTTTGLFTISAGAQLSTGTLSGPGAISVVKGTTKVTTTGVSDALTLADGTDGQIITIIHDVDGGSAVLTPTTKTGFSTITFTAVGEACVLQFVTTRGWIILSIQGAVAT